MPSDIRKQKVDVNLELGFRAKYGKGSGEIFQRRQSRMIWSRCLVKGRLITEILKDRYES